MNALIFIAKRSQITVIGGWCSSELHVQMITDPTTQPTNQPLLCSVFFLFFFHRISLNGQGGSMKWICSACILVLVVLVDLSEGNCGDHFTRIKEWGKNLTVNVKLAKTQNITELIVCTVIKSTLPLLKDVNSDCFTGTILEHIQCGEDSEESLPFYHIMCLAAKLVMPFEDVPQGCNYENMSILYPKVKYFGDYSETTTTPPTTTTTTPPTTTTTPPTTTTTPPPTTPPTTTPPTTTPPTSTTTTTPPTTTTTTTPPTTTTTPPPTTPPTTTTTTVLHNTASYVSYQRGKDERETSETDASKGSKETSKDKIYLYMMTFLLISLFMNAIQLIYSFRRGYCRRQKNPQGVNEPFVGTQMDPEAQCMTEVRCSQCQSVATTSPEMASMEFVSESYNEHTNSILTAC